MADRPQIIGTDDKGQFQVPLPRAQIERIDVIDIDFVLQTKSGERLIIPGAAMDAMTAAPPTVVFTDGPINAAAMLGMVDKVETPPVSIPAMTSLKEFDQKRTEGQKNVTRDGPEGRQTKSGEDAEPQHQTQEQAQQVAPLPHQGAESTVDKLLAQAENLEAETLKKAFDPAPIKPYEPPASNPDAPGSQPPTARIPLYMALAEGNVVGVSNTTIADTPTLLAKSGGVDILADTAVTYTNLVSGSSGPEDVAATTTDNEGSSVADGILPGDAKQYGTETLIGSAGNDLILADGYHGTGFENTQAMYAQLDPETGKGGTLYYAKEFQLSVAGYIRTVTSITISGLPEGVVAVVLNGVTYSVANGKLVNGTVSIPTGDIIPDAKTMTIIYDANAVATSAAGVDAEISVNVKGYGVGPIDTTKVFVWRFQDVDSTSDITGNNPKYIQGDGEHVSSGWSDIYVMETASAPHLILTFGGTYDTALSFGANVAANAALAATDGANLVYAGNSNDTIIAGNGNDTIFSYAGNDTIHAGNGTNVVWAGAGDDMVITGTGDDSVLAGGGNDVVFAGGGTNVVEGGDGNDVLAGGDGSDTLKGGAGQDILYGGKGSNVLDGGDGNADWLSFNGGSGMSVDAVSLADWMNYVGPADISGVTVVLGAGGVGTATHGGDTDTITGVENLIGSRGDDTLNVQGYTGVSHTLYGLAGNDVLIGADLADTLYGGDGNDQISGGGGNDYIDVGEGESSNYIVFTNALGTSYAINNSVDGGAGADTVVGGSGRDYFYAKMGEAADANDASIVDTFDGGAGIDTVDFSSYTTRLVIDLGTETVSADTTLIAKLSNIEEVIGGNVANTTDTIIGSSGNDIIWGGNGTNSMYSGGGSDYIYGGSGNDYFYSYNGSTLDNIQYYDGGNGSNYFYLYGSTENITGGSGWDRIYYSTQSSASFSIKVGSATYSFGVFVNLDNTDHAVDSTGALITADGSVTGSWWWTGSSWVEYSTGWSSANAQHGLYGYAQDDSYSSIDEISGSSRNDVLIGDDNRNTIYGNNGDDALYGEGGDDYVVGGSGNDYLNGGSGNDILRGEAGNDTLVGGDGSDWADYRYVTSASTRVTADLSAGTATVGTSGDNDKLISIENLYGGSGNDILTGDAGANSIVAGAGNDIITGNGGADMLFGEAGADVFNLTAANLADIIAGPNAIIDGGTSQGDNDKVVATTTWSFSAGIFDNAKWVSIEEIDVRDGTAGASEDYSLNSTDIRNIVDNGNSSSLQLYLDSGDTFTFSNSDNGSVTYSQTGGFSNGAALTTGTYTLNYMNGATQVAQLVLHVT